jgi:polar amino acid transport system ATP-binding protein
VLVLEDIHKRFGEVEVLRGVSLTVQKGEVSVLLGPSGGGKSTLLRTINGLETFDRGRIRFDGLELSASGKQDAVLARVRRRVGMVFQQFNLFPHLSVLDNVTLGPRRALGVDRRTAEAKARELLARFGLGDKADEYPNRISGGQNQRAAIVRALMADPEILLLDEVTSALDPELVGEVLGVIRELAERGMTMVLATHEMGFARDVADRVCFLHEGRVLESAPPKEFFASPREERTQQFLRRVSEAGRL